MRAIVVYESIWGNTEKVARAVAAELESSMTVELFDTDSAPALLDAYDLVVVGGPTHAFSMSRPATRETAVSTKGAERAPVRGIREWIEAAGSTLRDIAVAVFDTRVETPRMPGSAAKVARRALGAHGFNTTVDAESFRVHGYEGPLVDGELERATLWARELAATTT
jgi:flavorubredoxin